MYGTVRYLYYCQGFSSRTSGTKLGGVLGYLKGRKGGLYNKPIKIVRRRSPVLLVHSFIREKASRFSGLGFQLLISRSRIEPPKDANLD
jgi:hypothetical protein